MAKADPSSSELGSWLEKLHTPIVVMLISPNSILADFIMGWFESEVRRSIPPWGRVVLTTNGH